ncbi:MAG TPA: hypothetical protein PLP57_05555 [Candidatus Saccharicenans sp.]|nr:hypothetical protein [Candidatus Saccharicenans sp.]HRD02095.1 hypothetical protein [Candidatus Saccharicenans sp.]
MKSRLASHSPAKFLVFFMLLYLASHSRLEAQLKPGQYLEESPLGSWNQFGIDSAATLGTGLSQLTLSRNNQIILSNPALLSSLKSGSLTINSGFNQTQLSKFWLVNTGVISTDSNLTYRGFELNYLGFNYNSGQYSLGLAWAQTENYSRPSIDYHYIENDTLYDQLRLRQAGQLDVLGLALARKFKTKLSLGFSLMFLSGKINRELQEGWPPDGIYMTDNRQQKITGFYPVFGLGYLINSRLSLGLSFIPPHQRKIKGQSLLRYTSDEADIAIEGEADDRARMPLVMGAGIRYKLKENLNLFFESRYFAWDHYSYSYFGEDQSRDFRRIFELGAGLEYQTQARFLGKRWITPYYVGFKIDPQPMTDISSTYYYLTFGSGFGNDSFVLSFSTAIGFEHGSGYNLKNQKIAVTLDIYPKEIFKPKARR